MPIFFVSAAERMDRFEAHQLGDFVTEYPLDEDTRLIFSKRRFV